MFCRFSNFLQDRNRFTLILVGILICIALATNVSLAQRRAAPDDQEPALSEFKGVRIGMKTDEARKKLGNPTDKGAEQDFYVFNDTQAVQIFYDKAGAVTAISIDFMSGEKVIPSAKEVLGSEADTKPDGGVYKMVRYPKAGYWLSYSRTAGNSPTTTITMQKIEH